MSRRLDPNSSTIRRLGELTLTEIRQQPELWPKTLELVRARGLQSLVRERISIICGAGSSAYAGSAIAAGWSRASAIPTTDLLVHSKQELLRRVPAFDKNGLVVSLARSGDSPESIAVVTRMQQMFPEAKHLVITCNENGRLASCKGVEALVLDSRTNDRSLVMTSSFTNLVLAGLAVVQGEALAKCLARIVVKAKSVLPELEMVAERLASRTMSRLMILTSSDLAPLGREACLKVLEMTAGRITPLAETFLGVRHGPISFLRSDSLILCVLSSNDHRRRYEEDLLCELRHKKLGHLVVIGPPNAASELGHVFVPAVAPDVPDYLRTPFEIVFPQLLGYHLSLASDLDPDCPSPDGVITRVVKPFRLYKDIPLT